MTMLIMMINVDDNNDDGDRARDKTASYYINIDDDDESDKQIDYYYKHT